MKELQESQYRRICYTLSNYTEDELELLRNYKNVKIHVAGFEEAPTTGTPHIQGYIEFISKQRFAKIKKDFGPRFHFERCYGDRKSNIDYIANNKDKPAYKQFIYFISDDITTDSANVQEVKSWIESGISLEEILDDPSYGATAKTIKLYKELAPIYQKPRSWRPEVIWIYGEAGHGKTLYVHSQEPSLYILQLEKKWFDGYTDQQAILWDDLDWDLYDGGVQDSSRDKLEQQRLFQRLLSLCDRYAFRGNVKGSSVQIVAKRIYLVAHQPPWELWRPSFSVWPRTDNIHQRPTPEAIRSDRHLSQIMRRITRIVHLELDNVDDIVYPEVEHIKHGTKSKGMENANNYTPVVEQEKRGLVRIFKR